MKIHAIQTGKVKIKVAQRRRTGGGMASVIFGREWTEWLPIYAWLIEHPEGLLLVDTGETAKTSDRGYFPRWHPYFKLAVRIEVAPSQEIGHQLRSLGFDASAVQKIVMTHLHTDHAGGLHHFPDSEIYVSEQEFIQASGFSGRLQGYLPHRWPDWFSPTFIEFQPKPLGPFAASMPITKAGDVVVVPTPGHTPHHVSVLAFSDDLVYFLAGDTSYSQALLLGAQADGVSPDPQIATQTLDNILTFARDHQTIYLPSHDPEAKHRLETKSVLRISENRPLSLNSKS